MFLNTTETIGIIIGAANETTTGDLFSTLMLILLFLLAVCIMFGIPLEYISILILPYGISCMAYYSNFIGPTAVIFIYIAVILTKNWIYK